MLRIFKVAIPGDAALCRAALTLAEATFGQAEAATAGKQLSGAEQVQNSDTLYVATEEGALLGMCHLTVPRHMMGLGALSDVATEPSARRRGIAETLCTAALRDFAAEGGEALFLATENPHAAKLYQSLGFAFAPGANVMVHCTKGTPEDFYRAAFAKGHTQLLEGDCALRVPMVPLVLQRGNGFLLDRNIGILSTQWVTQRSCGGLYPRYEALAAAGGVFMGVQNEKGMLCALGTAAPFEGRTRIDLFAHPDFRESLLDLHEELAQDAFETVAEIAECDVEKQALFRSLGYVKRGYSQAVFGNFAVTCGRWIR